jgi:glycolate dehydrogenase FAD-binding subunit
VARTFVDVRDRLDALLGPSAISRATPATWSVEGLEPTVAVRPADAQQLAAVLRVCGESGAAVVPWGVGMAMSIGNVPRTVDVVVRTDALTRAVDYDPSNLTLTVEAGATLGAIATTLIAQRQFLPLDPPRAEAASIGGTAAVALTGPRRMRYGAARDLVIGIRVARTDGTLIRWGGKTVKNVAGYDMCKLFVGSLGTLGIITELTVKVFPVPEVTRTIAVWGGSLASLIETARRIGESSLLPSALVIVNRAQGSALGREAAGLLVRVDGVEPAVARHERDIASWAGRPGVDIELLSGASADAVWRSIRDSGWIGNDGVVRVSVPSGSVAGVLERAGRRLADGIRCSADAATGAVWFAGPMDDIASVQMPAWLDLGGPRSHVLLARVPTAVKESGDVWAPVPSGRALDVMRDLKRSFDPQGVLNPGRFIAGL